MLLGSIGTTCWGIRGRRRPSDQLARTATALRHTLPLFFAPTPPASPPCLAQNRRPSAGLDSRSAPLRPAGTKEHGAAALYEPNRDIMDAGGACANWTRARWRLQGIQELAQKPPQLPGPSSARCAVARPQ